MPDTSNTQDIREPFYEKCRRDIVNRTYPGRSSRRRNISRETCKNVIIPGIDIELVSGVGDYSHPYLAVSDTTFNMDYTNDEG